MITKVKLDDGRTLYEIDGGQDYVIDDGDSITLFTEDGRAWDFPTLDEALDCLGN